MGLNIREEVKVALNLSAYGGGVTWAYFGVSEVCLHFVGLTALQLRDCINSYLGLNGSPSGFIQ